MNVNTDADIIHVTPETAQRWLSSNESNRAVKPGHVKTLAADMTDGRWAFTGEAIQFDTDGRLINGQHRLSAVVASGVTIPFLIVRGLDEDAQRHMDTGAKRSVGDALTMRGIKNASTVAAVGRLALLWATGRINSAKTSASSVEVQDFIFGDQRVLDAGQRTAIWCKAGLDIPPSAVGAAFWGILDAGNDENIVCAWFDDLAQLKTDGDGDPKRALLQRFATRRKNGESILQASALSMLIRAWNAQVEGKQIFKLPAKNKDGSVTIPTPLVKSS